MSSRSALAESPAAAENLAYVVCCMTRTGSSLLCDALSRIGIAGKPAEYFDIHQGNRDFWVREFNIEEPSQYLDKVLENATTPNGVFGTKLHWYQVPALMTAFGKDPAGIDIDKCLATRFATRKYLWLRRRNKVAQAISNYRALTTAVWRIGPTLPEKKARPAKLKFDLERIEHNVTMAEHFDRQWEIWFRLSRQPGMVLVYEDFCQQYEPTIRAVCDYIGVGGEGIQMPPPRFDKQADEISLEWEARYRRLKGLPSADDIAPAVTRPASQAVVRQAPPPRPAVEPLGPTAETSANTDSPMGAIVAYDLGSGQNVRLEAASNRRAWMDATPNRHANRCLPMTIANQHGWMMLSPCRVVAVWDGTERLDGISIIQGEGSTSKFALSHFGSGILTFALNFLFRTPPGVNLHLRGPANMPKDGISALEGVIETDWLQSTFTMNWQFTRANHPVIFEQGEPFAMISPVRRGDVESLRPEIWTLESNPEMERGFRAWSKSRDRFNADLKIADSEAVKAGWQRHYTRGETVAKERVTSHQTKLSVNEFVDHRTDVKAPE